MKKTKKYEPTFEERQEDNKLRDDYYVSVDEVVEVFRSEDEDRIRALFLSVRKFGNCRWHVYNKGKYAIQDEKMVKRIYKEVTHESFKGYVDTGYSDADLND